MSKNYKPKLYSKIEVDMLDAKILKQEADKERQEKEHRVKQAEWQVEDAEKIKAMIDHVKTFENMLEAIQIKSDKGKLASKYIKDKLHSASAGGYSLYNKLRR